MADGEAEMWSLSLNHTVNVAVQSIREQLLPLPPAKICIDFWGFFFCMHTKAYKNIILGTVQILGSRQWIVRPDEYIWGGICHNDQLCIA